MTKYCTQKFRAIDKLVKGAHFKSLNVAAQEEAIKQISADCSEIASEKLAQVKEA